MDHVTAHIEHDLREADCPIVQPLPIDRWIALSVLQKSIRRGDVQTAMRAAVTLLHLDKRAFYSRMIVIACEDVGIASPDVVAQVLTIASNAPLRRQVGELKAALHITRLLCEAVKVRLADEIYSIVDKGHDHAHLRQTLAHETDAALHDMVLDNQRPLPERCLALWYLAGTKRFPSDNLLPRTGSLDIAVGALRKLGSHPALTECCIRTLKGSRYPLSLWSPLLYAAMQQFPRNLVTWTDCYRPTGMVKGIPLVALDGFTRLGKTCFRKLQAATPNLKPFTTQQIALGMFYTEGFYLDKRLTCLKLDAYRRTGEMADITDAGLGEQCYHDLIDILVSNADKLEAIRRSELKGYLQNPPQPEQPTLQV